MRSPIHDFQACRAVEDRWSAKLDDWLAESYPMRPATMEEQWRGMDRLVRVALDEDGLEVGVDYKCDERAARTGNAFIETVSNDVSGRKGWALTTEADWVFYFVVPDRVFGLRADKLRAAIPDWQRRFPTRAARNVGRDGRPFRTLGVCVPLKEVAAVAEWVAHLDQGDGPVLATREEVME